MPDPEPAPAEEVKLCGILVSKDLVDGKKKTGYVNISGTTHAYADWVKPFLSRHVNGDVVDIIYKAHRNGGKTLVSIQKAKDPSKAVATAPAATPGPAPEDVGNRVREEAKKIEEKNGFKTGTQIIEQEKPVAKPDPEPEPAQKTSDSASPSPVQAAQVVHMWTGEAPKFGIECKVNLTNYDSIGFWVSGTLPDAGKLRQALYDEMGTYAQNNPLTKDLIEAYRRRVLA